MYSALVVTLTLRTPAVLLQAAAVQKDTTHIPQRSFGRSLLKLYNLRYLKRELSSAITKILLFSRFTRMVLKIDRKSKTCLQNVGFF